MYSRKMRLLSLNMILVMLLTLIPAQARDDTSTDEEKTYTITLNGNGGEMDGGVTEKIVICSEESPLDLGDYPFTRDGYVLVGWVSDLNSMKYEAGADETLVKTGSYGTLYAVWLQVPKDGNYIIIQGSQYNGASDSVKTSAGTFSSFALPEDGKFTLPDLASVSTKNGAAVWADRFTEEAYLSGETATLKPGAFLSGVWHSSDGTYVIFDGNGGTMTNTVNGVQHTVTRHLVGLRIGGTYYRETQFVKPGCMVISYNTKADGSGESYPVSSFTVPESMKEATVLYAQWAPLDQLKDGVRLIIDSDDMTGLFGKNDWNYGTGWRFRDIGGSASSTYGQIDITNSTRYSGGRIAFDGNLTLGFVDGVSVGQIEAAGSLTLVNNASAGAQFSVKTNGVAAIRAESVTIKNSAAVYRISAENAVAVDASSLYLSSPNVIIEGRQAVAKYTKITCASGIGYKMSSDGSTLMTYSDTKQITLEGNGGTLDGLPMTIAEYSAVDELDLDQYPFTQEGYVLVGWAADKEGKELVTDATGHLKLTDYETIYAVWLEVPKDSGYVILQALQDGYAGVYATKAGYSSVAMAEDGTVTLPEPNNPKGGIAIWRKSDTREPYFVGEKVTVPSGTRFDCVLYYNANKILIFDGNGGTTTSTVNSVQCTLSRQMVNAAVGGTYRSRSQFVKAGYTMTGYKDSDGRFYPGSDISVTADMKNPTILYAQWKEIDSNEDALWINGFAYTARENHVGDSWYYYYETDTECGYLSLSSYQGGDIKSDIDLSVSASGGACVVNGSISSEKTLRIGGGSETSSLTVTANEGSALYAKEEMRLLPAYKLTVTGKGAPAIVVTGTLEVGMNRNGAIEATGSPYALSYNTLLKDGYQRYQICGGADKGSAEPVTDDTYNNKPYISYEMRDRVLTLHGVDGVTETGENLYVVRSKSNSIDLGAYSSVFTNAGKRLLGWSKTEDSATIDYAAASSTAYCFEYNYEFEADLYAVWESDGQIGVVLKDFGCYGENGGYTYSEVYTVPVSGGTFELPKSYKSGYVFTGWLGGDGQTYTAGTQIEVSASTEFTALYATGTFEIDGKTYSTDRPHGSRSLGWEYDPHTEWNWGQAEIDVYSNYSGKPISVSGNIALHLDGMITGAAGQPAISADGNVRIYANRYGHSAADKLSAQVYGGAGAPAVKATGDIWIDGLNSYTQTLVFKGDNGRPAFEAQRVCFFEPLLAGESETAADFIGIYQAQSYVCAEYPITIEVKEGDVLPAFPDTAFRKFVGWQMECTMTGCPDIQYRPGDTYTGEQRMLVAYYMPSACGAVILDGNGGATTKDSKYYVIESSGADLRVTADTLTDAFQRDGYRIDAYSTDAAGKQNRTAAEDLAERLTGDTTIAGQIWTYFAQWKRIGDKTEDNSAYYTKADDGTVRIESVDQAVLEEQLKTDSTAQIDVSKLEAEKVMLPASAVNDVLDLEAEALSIKMAAAAVALDKTAIQSVIKTADSADIQLHVSTGSELSDNQVAIIGTAEQYVVLNVSLTAGTQEIHNFDGKVTVSVPFTWTEQGVLQAWYLADDGTKEPVEVSYRDGNAVLTLKHFSTYAIVVKVNDIDETIASVAGNTVTVNAPSEAASCVAALYSVDGQQMAVGKSAVADDKATVTWKSVDWTKVQTLKVFFLDADGAPIRAAAERLVKGGAE